MAKDTRTRKKVTRTVSEGVAHIHASLITPLLRLPIVKVMHWLGPPQVDKASVVHVNQLRLLLR